METEEEMREYGREYIADTIAAIMTDEHGCTMEARDYCNFCDMIDDYEGIEEWRILEGQRAWETARENDIEVTGPGASLVLYHGDLEQFRAAIGAETDDVRAIVLHMAMHEQREDYIDMICERGITEQIFYALFDKGPTHWVLEGLRTLTFDEDNERANATLVWREDVMELYPYIAKFGPLLYRLCTRETFEILFPTHSGAEHYLERIVSWETPARIRELVERGIDRDRALGEAMDCFRHWLLFSDAEQRELARAYGVDFDTLLEPSDVPAVLFVRKLVQGSLTARDEELIAAMREQAKVVEPLVPY